MAKGKPTEQLSRAMWQFLLYPDSMVVEFGGEIEKAWEYLDTVGMPVMVSPLHDCDVKEDGSGKLKKPHYHCMAQFDGPVPYRQALEYFEVLGVKILKQVPSRRTFERYTCHMDSPTKAQYDVADIRYFGGYQSKYLGDMYEQSSISQIHELIEELGIVYYPDLALNLSRDYPDLLSTLLRYSSHFNNFCYGRERLLKRYSGDNDSYVKYANTRRKIG